MGRSTIPEAGEADRAERGAHADADANADDSTLGRVR
jgi:hypothetical protein